jgi:hypothetical protein
LTQTAIAGEQQLIREMVEVKMILMEISKVRFFHQGTFATSVISEVIG